jgi:hypothetical protein
LKAFPVRVAIAAQAATCLMRSEGFSSLKNQVPARTSPITASNSAVRAGLFITLLT